MKQDSICVIDRLLRGVSTNHVETVRDAWRAGLAGDAETVALVEGKLRSQAWSEPPRGPVTRYLGVLLALLDELDRATFEREVKRLSRAGLHPLHRQTLEMMARRIGEVPVVHLAHGIPLFVADDIEVPAEIIGYLQRWSQTPGLSLDKVTRIDVIAFQPELAYLGKYNLFFSGIILTWPLGSARGIKRWWRGLMGEFTFYHEVGHHACGHLEGGQVAQQEEEADAYARAMMRRSRPVFTFVGRVLLWPLRPIMKRILKAAERRAG